MLIFCIAELNPPNPIGEGNGVEMTTYDMILLHTFTIYRRMDTKGESEEITYPKIYFAIDNFEEV